jgi:hypothetical protein
MKKQATSVTQSEFARRIGVSRQRVNAMIREGMPALPNGMVDLEAALKWVRSNVLPKQATTEDDSLVAKRMEKLDVEIELLRLDLTKKQGSYVTIEDVSQVWSQVIGNCRARLLGIPFKLAPEIAPETDVGACRQMLQREIHDALTELSEADLDVITEEKDAVPQKSGVEKNVRSKKTNR